MKKNGKVFNRAKYWKISQVFFYRNASFNKINGFFYIFLKFTSDTLYMKNRKILQLQIFH